MTRRFIWGQAAALFDRSRRLNWIDLFIVVGFAGPLVGCFDLAGEWMQTYRSQFEIDLDNPWVLPEYTFYSLSRGLIAYGFSLLFTLVHGYWAAKAPGPSGCWCP